MLQALIGSIFGVGLFLILADYFRVPFFKTSKAINNLAKRQEKKTSTLDILARRPCHVDLQTAPHQRIQANAA